MAEEVVELDVLTPGQKAALENLAKARVELHGWLDDLAALRPFGDPANADFKNFMVAWKIALEMAKDAAVKYETAAQRVKVSFSTYDGRFVY
jgi:hypothetical protein